MTEGLRHELVEIDLEFIGDIAIGCDNCRIFEIAAVVHTSGVVFQTFVDPCPLDAVIPAPIEKDCFHITKSFIEEHQIQPIEVCLHKLIDFLHNLDADSITLIGHATFRSDMLIIQNAVDRSPSVTWPSNIRFADSLQVCRISFPHQRIYNLSALHRSIVGTEMCCAHSAVHDAIALRSILMRIPHIDQVTVTYSLSDYPLSNLKEIGAKTELFVARCGINVNGHKPHNLTVSQFQTLCAYFNTL
tara:strand:+ start:3353 stop:4087 length:735 start_codon:yes stop_codon:yes gene_type:complete